MTLLHFYIVIYPAACICILAALFRADRSRAIVPAGIFALCGGIIWPVVLVATALGLAGKWASTKFTP